MDVFIQTKIGTKMINRFLRVALTMKFATMDSLPPKLSFDIYGVHLGYYI